MTFGSDAPFDTKGGAYLIRWTMPDVEGAVADEAERTMIFHDNPEWILVVESESPEPVNDTS